MVLRIGQRWQGTQRAHRGWSVRISKVSRDAVQFACLAGPGKSRGSHYWMRRVCFLGCFTFRA
jgi:hypothetical protein